MIALRLAPMMLLLGAGGAGLQAPEPLAALDLPLVDDLRVEKSARRMTLYAEGRVIGVIEGVQLGSEPVGAKRFQGDGRTPEGRYVIDWANPDSAYHLSLHISYPGDADRAYAASQGRDPGGMIMIHGQPNGHEGRVPGDWTNGCIAVSNEEMEALWEAVPDGTPIEIVS